MILTAIELSKLIDRELEHRLECLEFVDWHEDHISLVLVDALRQTLRNTNRIVVHPTGWGEEEHFFFEIEAYKATGALERSHGDIAIVVQDLDLGRVGTGFYEAKAEGPDGGYPAFNMRQLRRLSSSTPQLALLLYERAGKAVSNDEYSFCSRQYGRSHPMSRLRVIGASIAKKYSRPASIPDLPRSFGHHFVSRYLTGRDLDYARDPLLTIQRWLKITRRASPVVVSVRISRAPLPPADPMLIPFDEPGLALITPAIDLKYLLELRPRVES